MRWNIISLIVSQAHVPRLQSYMKVLLAFVEITRNFLGPFLPRYYIIIIIIVLPRGSVLGCRPPHILIPPCSNGESYPNDATTERSNAVDINAFFTRILNSLSLALSFSLYAPLALSIPKLTQHRIYPGMEGGLLGCLFALSPRPLIHPPTLPSLSACPPAMPWGLESCRMRRSSSLG